MKHLLALLLFAGTAWAAADFGSDCPYPEAQRAAGPAGNTDLSFTVAADGSLHDVAVIRPSNNPALDAAAVQCVSNWRSSGDPNWQGAVDRHSISIYWDIVTKNPAGHASAGRPHVCMYDYPAAEAAAGIGGTTLVGFRIKTDGTTSEIQVLQSSGNDNLDNAAKTCVVSWRYKPAMQDGVPVEVPWKAQVRWAPGEQPQAAPKP
jgi:TonB family protein